VDDCVFCKIAGKQIPSALVHEDDQLVAFNDVNPQAPMHMLIIPREHIPSLGQLDSGHDELVGRALRLAAELARQKGLSESGYRVVINCGKDAGQSVGHLHFHVLGGRVMGWPPG
jgi:histidine triad (HIT) family protein